MTHHRSELQPGDIVLDRYRVDAYLSKGGMGRVYRATHTMLELPVAVKILSHVGDDDLARRFEQEAKLIAKIRHPNVVRVLDYGRTGDGRPCFVMEYLEGQPLATKVVPQGMAWPEACTIMASVFDGLAGTHAAGLLHRDVKPTNILIVNDEDAPVRLIDFGIARDTIGPNRITRGGEIVGTPDYMAPEQLLGYPTDLRADIYSAMVVLFELIAGRLPFANADGSDLTALLGRLNTAVEQIEVPKEQPSVPPALLNLLVTGLSTDPERRPPTAAAVARDLRAIIANTHANVDAEELNKTVAEVDAAKTARQPDEPRRTNGAKSSFARSEYRTPGFGIMRPPQSVLDQAKRKTAPLARWLRGTTTGDFAAASDMPSSNSNHVASNPLEDHAYVSGQPEATNEIPVVRVESVSKPSNRAASEPRPPGVGGAARTDGTQLTTERGAESPAFGEREFTTHEFTAVGIPSATIDAAALENAALYRAAVAAHIPKNFFKSAEKRRELARIAGNRSHTFTYGDVCWIAVVNGPDSNVVATRAREMRKSLRKLLGADACVRWSSLEDHVLVDGAMLRGETKMPPQLRKLLDSVTSKVARS